MELGSKRNRLRPFWRDRVEFVKEQHAWLGSTSPLEDIPNGLFTRANVLVQQLWALDADEI